MVTLLPVPIRALAIAVLLVGLQNGTFARAQTQRFIVPVPKTCTIDDVGWKLVYSEQEKGGPSRLGLPPDFRSPTLLDYSVIAYVARAVGTRISCKFVLSEFDRENLCALYPTTNEQGSNWDNSSLISEEDFQIMDFLKENAAWIELGLHGVRHHYWDWDSAPNVIIGSEFFHEKTHIPYPFEKLVGHLECFAGILRQYGIYDFPKSFTTPGEGYYFAPETGKDTGALLHRFGVKYAQSNLNDPDMVDAIPDSVRQAGGAIDNGVLWLHTETILPYNAIAVVPSDYPTPELMLTHWPNWWHEDPSRNTEVGDRYIAWFQRLKRQPQWYVPKNTAQHFSQWLYRKYSRITDHGGLVELDNRSMPLWAYDYNLLGNLVLKIPLKNGEHVSSFSVDGDAHVVAYFEELGYGYLFLSPLARRIYHLEYQIGPEMPSYYVWHDGTYNIFSFQFDSTSALLDVEMYGRQTLKIFLPFSPIKAFTNTPNLSVESLSADSTTGLCSVTLRAHNIQGTRGTLTLVSRNYRQLQMNGWVGYYSTHEGVPSVKVRIQNLPGFSTLSLQDGSYSFDQLPVQDKYNLLYAKDPHSDVNQSILVYDAALLAQSVIGLKSLTVAQKMRADVNRDGKLTFFDAALIARYALSLPSPVPSWVGSWIFLPNSKTLSLSQIARNHTDTTWAMLMGDVDGNWTQKKNVYKPLLTASDWISEVSFKGDTLILHLPHRKDNRPISLQLDLTYNRNLQFLDIHYSDKENTVCLLQNSGNRLVLGLYSRQPKGLENERIWLTFHRRSRSTPIVFQVNEYFHNNKLVFKGPFEVHPQKTATLPFSFAQNYPNPARNRTTFIFTLPDHLDLNKTILRIYDIKGNLVHTIAISRPKPGLNRYTWDGTDSKGKPLPSGIYFVQLQAGSYRAVQKISIVH